MAHSNEFTGDSLAGKSAQVVDERRKHAPILTETVAFEEFDHWIDVALESPGRSLDSYRCSACRAATVLGSTFRGEITSSIAGPLWSSGHGQRKLAGGRFVFVRSGGGCIPLGRCICRALTRRASEGM